MTLTLQVQSVELCPLSCKVTFRQSGGNLPSLNDGLIVVQVPMFEFDYWRSQMSEFKTVTLYQVEEEAA